MALKANQSSLDTSNTNIGLRETIANNDVKLALKEDITANDTKLALKVDNTYVGAVTSTEHSYLDGVTSSIQTQIDGLGGGGGGETLQETYDLSTAPQITTSVAKGAMTFQGLTGVSNTLEVKNNAGTKVAHVSLEGNVDCGAITSQTITDINNSISNIDNVPDANKPAFTEN